MAKKTWIKVGGVWKEVKVIWEKVAGVWQPGVISWRKIGINWKVCKDYSLEPPIVNVGCSDGSITLINVTTDLGINSNQLTVWWTPTNMATSPHTNYLSVTKSGPVLLYSGQRNGCSNGAGTSLTMTISELAVSGRTYYVDIVYSNV